jgi:hypothetical protein
MESWRKYLPDYKIIEWNEDSFDITSNTYVQQAYESKKWAFVTDYVRLYALKNYGGIYLDTDVELFSSLDKFLNHGFFSGFEFYNGNLSPITAIMGACKSHHLIERLILDYDNVEFRNSDGTLNLQTNTRKITKILVEEIGIDPTLDKYQSIDSVVIYPSNILCNKSPDSVAVHHFGGSWVPWRQKVRKKIRNLVNR